jgi:hypothetical protein
MQEVIIRHCCMQEEIIRGKSPHHLSLMNSFATAVSTAAAAAVPWRASMFMSDFYPFSFAPTIRKCRHWHTNYLEEAP